MYENNERKTKLFIITDYIFIYLFYHVLLFLNNLIQIQQL